VAGCGGEVQAMKIVTVVGARPQFIKAAPLSRVLRAYNREVLVHTGQHYDEEMSAVFFRELGVPEPDYNLEVGSGPHGRQTGEMLKRIEEVLEHEQPSWVLVYGDTNSTLAGALAAAKMHIAVAHIEAGVRSYNRAMPEELNRVLTDQVASLLFCPTVSGVENLRREGVTRGVHYVGDVMRDAQLMFAPVARERSTILEEVGLGPRRYALLTAHRPENVDDNERLTRLMAAVSRLDLPIAFPAHPRTRKRLQALGLLGSLGPHVKLLPPLGYLDMLRLQGEALVVLTDSGGVQREAHFLSVPSIILRRETEWPELIAAGASRLVGEDFADLTTDLLKSVKPVPPCGVFGAGDASAKIARELSRAAGNGKLGPEGGPHEGEFAAVGGGNGYRPRCGPDSPQGAAARS
jgi:UDP-GlcNAc3NAcA epimerase